MSELNQLKDEIVAQAEKLTSLLEQEAAHEFSLARSHVQQAVRYVQQHVVRAAALANAKAKGIVAELEADAEAAALDIGINIGGEEPTKEPTETEEPAQ